MPRLTDRWGSPVVGQLTRYAIGGLISAAIYSFVYLVLVAMLFPGRQAVFAVLPAFLVAASCGLHIHGKWSFRGHGQAGAGHALTMRFLLVQVAGLTLTSVMTWVITDGLGGPPWVAIVPSVLVTPLITFQLQRRWVFAG